MFIKFTKCFLPIAKPSFTEDSPNQPELSFPQRIFGMQKQSFCSSWYVKYKWLHYQEGTDRVFCYYCLVADKRGLKTQMKLKN